MQIHGSGTSNFLNTAIVTDSGRLLVDTVTTGSLLMNGSLVIKEVSPINTAKNNQWLTLIYMTSGTATGITGSEIGSMVMFIGAGSFVRRLIYSNNNLTDVGSWI